MFIGPFQSLLVGWASAPLMVRIKFIRYWVIINCWFKAIRENSKDWGLN